MNSKLKREIIINAITFFPNISDEEIINTLRDNGDSDVDNPRSIGGIISGIRRTRKSIGNRN